VPLTAMPTMGSNAAPTDGSEPVWIEWKEHGLPWYTEEVGDQLLPEVRCALSIDLRGCLLTTVCTPDSHRVRDIQQDTA
jgi:hypothetical protein